MLHNYSNIEYETPELSFVEVAVEEGFAISDSSIEDLGGEKEEIEW